MDKKSKAKSQNLVTQIRRKTESSQSKNSPVDRILFLQRTIGNQAVGKLIKSGALQAKLRIGQPGDVYEQEADRVAEQVMSMPEPVQRKCLKCEDEVRRQPEKEETIPGPSSMVFRVVDRNALIRKGPPGFEPTSQKIPRGTDVKIVRYNKAKTRAEVQQYLLEGSPPQWTAVANLVEKHEISGYKTTGTLSEVSWGETSGLYPAHSVEYDPEMWDASLTQQLLVARCAIDAIGSRGESVHRARPRANDPIEQKLKTYHLIENFPPLDAEISDPGVKWFYLSKNAAQQNHPGLKALHVRVKSYGPFYNSGGGDVPRGLGVYLHFFKLK